MYLDPQQVHNLLLIAVGWLSGVASVGIYVFYSVDRLIKGRNSFPTD